MTRLLSLLSLLGSLSVAGPPPIESPTPSVPSPAKAAPNAVWIERFDAPLGTELSKLGWSGGQERNGKKDHFLVKDGDRTVLRSAYLPGTEAKYISKEIDWDTGEYPYLSWRWRARKLPKGGRVLDKKVSDAAAQIYVLWTVGRRKNIVKYYWAAGDKPGEELHQSSLIFGKLFGLILRSGGPLGEWRTEMRNVHDDYFNAFGTRPKEHVRGIALLSDADETGSESEADYADFQRLRKPE